MPRFDPHTIPKFAALLEYHRSQPGVTFAEHLASLEEELAREVLGKYEFTSTSGTGSFFEMRI